MNIAIISPEFNPSINYNETLLARALSELGNTVCVFTSNGDIFGDSVAAVKAQDYDLVRFKRVLKLSSTRYLVGNEGSNAVKQFSPQLIIVNVPDRGIGPQILKNDFPNAKIVSIFADLLINTGHPFLRKILKAKWYKRAFSKSDLLIAVTPETASLIRKKRGLDENPPIWMSGLAFDGDVFYPSNTIHHKIRVFRGKHSKILGLITRISSNKPFEKWLQIIDKVLSEDANAGLVIAGVDDDKSWVVLKEYLAGIDYSDRIVVLGLQDATDLCAIYAGIDVSLWFQASIGIQQSLACGVPVIVPEEDYLSHFIEHEENAMVFKTLNNITEVICHALSFGWDKFLVREKIVQFEKLKIAESLLQRVREQESRVEK